MSYTCDMEFCVVRWVCDKFPEGFTEFHPIYIEWSPAPNTDIIVFFDFGYCSLIIKGADVHLTPERKPPLKNFDAECCAKTWED